MSDEEKQKIINIEELSSYQFIIPLYQRNYAWGDIEIETLLDDISHNDNDHYYLGSIVVYNRGDRLEVVDGQQRLTTLAILFQALGLEDKKIKLEFECRDSATKALACLGQDNKDTEDSDKEVTDNITHAYQIMLEILKKEQDYKEQNYKEQDYKEQDYKEKWKGKLDKVFIAIVELPPDTELNHYFEIMNNRGEQLEQHEILKAQLMANLDDDTDKKVFAKIWDSCANFDYHIEHELGKEIDLASCSDFQSIAKIIKDENCNNNEDEKNLADIIKGGLSGQKIKEEKESQYKSIIDFPNFLLHVLAIYRHDKNNSDTLELSKLLNDVKLVENFKKENEDKDKVKEFISILFKCKVLFDRYIIKGAPDKNSSAEDNYHIHSWRKNENSKNSHYSNTFSASNTDNLYDNKRLVFLQTVFHHSYPRKTRKYWLTGTLFYLYRNQLEKVDIIKYINYLERLSKYMFKYSCSAAGIELNDLIKDSEDVDLSEINAKSLSYGRVSTFAFNYLEYLLFKKYRDNSTCVADFIKRFRLTRRFSIEHYYPQDEQYADKFFSDNRKEDCNDKERCLHSFGNLCLVTAKRNSALSNHSCEEKRNRYKKLGVDADSIKQFLMFYGDAKNKKEIVWNCYAIKEHEKAMLEILNLVKK